MALRGRVLIDMLAGGTLPHWKSSFRGTWDAHCPSRQPPSWHGYETLPIWCFSRPRCPSQFERDVAHSAVRAISIPPSLVYMRIMCSTKQATNSVMYSDAGGRRDTAPQASGDGMQHIVLNPNLDARCLESLWITAGMVGSLAQREPPGCPNRHAHLSGTAGGSL